MTHQIIKASKVDNTRNLEDKLRLAKEDAEKTEKEVEFKFKEHLKLQIQVQKLGLELGTNEPTNVKYLRALYSNSFKNSRSIEIIKNIYF